MKRDKQFTRARSPYVFMNEQVHYFQWTWNFERDMPTHQRRDRAARFTERARKIASHLVAAE
jgi:hypothetical protein